MKSFYILPLLFLSACSTAPKLALQPLPSSNLAANTVRYPETIRAYHFGRYVDPNDNLVMHEQHTVYRVEQNARWDLRPLQATTMSPVDPASPETTEARDVAFYPTPINDAILAEVNAQRLATAQIMRQSRILAISLAEFQSALAQTRTNLYQTAQLRVTVNELQKRLDALTTTPAVPAELSTTNEPNDPLSP